MAVSRALAKRPEVAIAALVATLKCEIGSPFANTPFRVETKAWDALAPEIEGDYRWGRNFEAALDTPEFTMQMLAVFVSKLIDLRHPRYDDRQWSDRQRSENFNIALFPPS